jgi:hypothetical protein
VAPILPAISTIRLEGVVLLAVQAGIADVSQGEADLHIGVAAAGDDLFAGVEVGSFQVGETLESS